MLQQVYSPRVCAEAMVDAAEYQLSLPTVKTVIENFLTEDEG